MFPELKLHKGRPYGTSFLNLKIKNHFYTSGRTRAILFCLTELQMIHYASAFCLRGMCSADMLLASPGSIQTYGLMDKWINQSHTMYCWEKKHHTFHSGTFTDGVTGKNESLLTKKRKKKQRIKESSRSCLMLPTKKSMNVLYCVSVCVCVLISRRPYTLGRCCRMCEHLLCFLRCAVTIESVFKKKKRRQPSDVMRE